MLRPIIPEDDALFLWSSSDEAAYIIIIQQGFFQFDRKYWTSTAN